VQKLANLGGIEWDIESNEILFSNEAKLILGISSEAKNPTFEDFLNNIHVNDKNRVKDEVEKALKNKKPFNVDYTILKPNGFLIMTNWNLWQIGAKKNVWTSLLSSLLSLLSSSRKRGSRLINTRSQIRSGMAIKDIITLWQNQFPLYYHAFTKRELKKLLQKTNFEVLENYYVKQGQKARWWNGYNILTVAKKIIV